MASGKGISIVASLAAGGVLVVGLLALAAGAARPARADPTTLFASPAGVGAACSRSEPCSLPTALSQASDGDAIYAAGGSYTGSGSSAFVVVASVDLYGGWDGAAEGAVVRNPAAYPTILDGERQRRVVMFSGNVSPTLDGFAIVNGNASGGGAGIGLYHFAFPAAAPIVRNCLISNNVTLGSWGGGIAAEGGRPLIEGCRILSNTTRHQGGGVAATHHTRATLRNNLIAGNEAEWWQGAGIRVEEAWVTLASNTIVSNTGAFGDGIYAGHSTISVVNNIVIANNYGLRGYDVTATISHNDVWGNTTANYGGMPDPTGTDGNISLDPLFVSGPGGDTYLSQLAAGQAADSPCVDAGSGLAADLGLDNLTTRIDREVDRGTVDMGYHYRGLQRAFLPLALKG